MPRESKEARALRQRAELDQFLLVLDRAGNSILPEAPVCEGRKWRVDYLIEVPFGLASSVPNVFRFGIPPVALEIQGWGFGHVGRAGWLRDIEKAQAIAANGWLYLPVTREDVASGQALVALAACGVPVESRTPIQDNIEANGGKYVGPEKMRVPKMTKAQYEGVHARDIFTKTLKKAMPESFANDDVIDHRNYNCVECYDTGRVAYLGAKYAIGSPCPNGCVPVEGK